MPAKRKAPAKARKDADPGILEQGKSVDVAEDSGEEEVGQSDDDNVHDIGDGDYAGDHSSDEEGGEEDDDDEEEEDEEDEEEGEGDDEGEAEDGEEEEEDLENADGGSSRTAQDLWDSDEDGDDDDDEDDSEDDTPAGHARSLAGTAGLSGGIEGGMLNNGVGVDPNWHITPESDSEEDGPLMRNPVGNIPMEWYKDEKHIGYDREGKKIIKKPGRDALDRHLQKSDDPESWRNVYDEVNDEDLRLTDAEVKLLKRLRAGKFDPGYNPYEDYPVPYDAPEHKIHPLSNRPEPKSRFVPSKHEAKQVVKYVRMIRAGKILFPPPQNKPEDLYNYDVWEKEHDVKHRGAVPIAAPKPKLPGHAESYNPPQEYLFNDEEAQQWARQEPSDRSLNFLPRKFDALRKVQTRHACSIRPRPRSRPMPRGAPRDKMFDSGARVQVPLYSQLLQERFERCLDLYLCPRAVKKRMNVDPESLLPKLPKPQELKPYPSVLTVLYEGHTGAVNSISVHHAGQYFASGSQDGWVRVWEISSGRCWRKFKIGAPVVSVAWNPNPLTPIIAAAAGDDVVFLDVAWGDDGAASADIRRLISAGREARATQGSGDAKKELVEWLDGKEGAAEAGEGAAAEAGEVLRLRVSKPLKQVAWHYKGDYLVTLAPTANTKAVLIHQLSKMQSQNPFTKSKADAQQVLFHPNKPFLLVATKKHVKVYNLTKQTLAKSLIGGFKSLSGMDIHPAGDNVICSSFDRRLSWFDMDLSTKPYKTMRYNNTGLRSVNFHKRYPLFAAGGEDGMVYIFHGMVYNDLMENPLIVPLKRIHAHKCDGYDGVIDLAFHPTQPWLLTCGVDNSVRLFTEA